MGLLGALACDGVVAGTQKALQRDLKEKGIKEKNFEMQFLTNLYMCITAIVFALVMDEFWPGIKFLAENQKIIYDIALCVLCSAVGQAFIFFTIASFDPLVCTTVTTTRKVFSVLLSIFTKGHVLNTVGWSGIAMACGGILGELEEK